MKCDVIAAGIVAAAKEVHTRGWVEQLIDTLAGRRALGPAGALSALADSIQAPFESLS